MKTVSLSAIALLVAFTPTLALADFQLPDPFHDPVIHSDIPMVPDKPVIHSDIDMFPNQPSGPSNGGPGGPAGPSGPSLGVIDAKVIGGDLAKCLVRGTPSEFPDDLVIVNAGVTTLSAGTEIKWTIKSSHLSGIVTLTKALGPGKSVKLNGVLAGGLEADTPCSAKVL